MKPYYLLLFLSSLAMSQTSAPPTSNEPPQGIVCFFGDTYRVGDNIWDCETEGTVIPSTMHRWRLREKPAQLGDLATPTGPVTYSFPNCSDSVTFHGKSKKIAEIFPEECTGTGKIDVSEYLREPSDVPAIQEEYVKHEAHECWGEGDLLRCASDTPDMGKRWTCADKANYSLLTSVDGSKHICHRLEGK